MLTRNNYDHIKLIVVEKPQGKFIATFNDGSGACIFQVTKLGELYDCEGECCDWENLDDFLHWIPLPDDFMMYSDYKDLGSDKK